MMGDEATEVRPQRWGPDPAGHGKEFELYYELTVESQIGAFLKGGEFNF